MLCCSSCNQSRWAEARFGRLADDLEWLTGWTPYWCQACARRGWHHSHRTPPALQDFREAFPRLSLRRISLSRLSLSRLSLSRLSLSRLSLSRLLRNRPALNQISLNGLSLKRLSPDWKAVFPRTMPSGRLLTTSGGLASAFALGVWIGALVFSGPTTGVELQSLAAANELAQKPVAHVAPPIEVAPPVEVVRAAVTPLVTDLSPDVAATVGVVHPPLTPPVAAGSLRSESKTPKPVTRVAAARDRRDEQRPPAAVKALNRAPQANARPSARRASVTAPPSPALPRYHGSLVIRSEPLGALVSVDGRVVGPTPLLLKGIRAGSRVVRIESQGYERWSSAARVVANQETAVVATLQRGSGH